MGNEASAPESGSLNSCLMHDVRECRDDDRCEWHKEYPNLGCYPKKEEMTKDNAAAWKKKYDDAAEERTRRRAERDAAREAEEAKEEAGRRAAGRAAFGQARGVARDFERDPDAANRARAADVRAGRMAELAELMRQRAAFMRAAGDKDEKVADAADADVAAEDTGTTFGELVAAIFGTIGILDLIQATAFIADFSDERNQGSRRALLGVFLRRDPGRAHLPRGFRSHADWLLGSNGFIARVRVTLRKNRAARGGAYPQSVLN